MNTQTVPLFTPNASKRKIKFSGPIAIEYEVFKIVDEYDSILKLKGIDWDFSNPPGNLQYIVVSMIQTMLINHGVGLAANQCGLRYNIFVMGTGQYVEAVINPEILEIGSEEEISQEGCLSYPGLFMKVKRSKHIKVKYYNVEGKEIIQEFDGLTARIFQHEFDHLQGIKFTERASKIAFMQAKGKVKSNLRKLKQYEKRLRLEKAQEKAQEKPELKNPITENYANISIIDDIENNISLVSMQDNNLLLSIPDPVTLNV